MRLRSHVINIHVFRFVYNCVQCNSSELFTLYMKKTKDATRKNGDINGTCKQLKVILHYK